MLSRAFFWRAPRAAGGLPELLGTNFFQRSTFKGVTLSEKVSEEEKSHHGEWLGENQSFNGRFSQTWSESPELSMFAESSQGYARPSKSSPEKDSSSFETSPEQRQSTKSWPNLSEHHHSSHAFGHLLLEKFGHSCQQLSGFTLPTEQPTNQRRQLSSALSPSLFSNSVPSQSPWSNINLELASRVCTSHRILHSSASSESNVSRETHLIQVHSLYSCPSVLHLERLNRGKSGICVQHLSTDSRTTAAKPLENESLSKVQVSEEAKKVEVRSGQGWSSWTKDEAFNLPNAISMARLISGPAIGGLIVAGHHKAALGALVVAGASDWLDGYVAKHYNIVSTLGTYLDPLADKVLMGSVAAALAYEGTLPVWLVSLVVARDVALIGAAALHRGRTLGWKWNGWSSYFQLGKGGAPKVRPLFISKANTVFQLALVGCALTHSAYGIPAQGGVNALCYLVGTTTLLSWLGYFVVYLRNPARLVE